MPGLYSWGFNDETCPPTYSADDVISAPKRLNLAFDTGHRSTQEQVDEVNDWLADERLGKGRPSAAVRWVRMAAPPRRAPDLISCSRARVTGVAVARLNGTAAV